MVTLYMSNWHNYASAGTLIRIAPEVYNSIQTLLGVFLIEQNGDHFMFKIVLKGMDPTQLSHN